VAGSGPGCSGKAKPCWLAERLTGLPAACGMEKSDARLSERRDRRSPLSARRNDADWEQTHKVSVLFVATWRLFTLTSIPDSLVSMFDTNWYDV